MMVNIMAMLQNHRHELFAQGIVEGKSADQAYADAGFKPGRNNAARLRANENIQAIDMRDELYPPLLKEIYDPPPLLYYKGRLYFF